MKNQEYYHCTGKYERLLLSASKCSKNSWISPLLSAQKCSKNKKIQTVMQIPLKINIKKQNKLCSGHSAVLALPKRNSGNFRTLKQIREKAMPSQTQEVPTSTPGARKKDRRRQETIFISKRVCKQEFILEFLLNNKENENKQSLQAAKSSNNKNPEIKPEIKRSKAFQNKTYLPKNHKHKSNSEIKNLKAHQRKTHLPTDYKPKKLTKNMIIKRIKPEIKTKAHQKKTNSPLNRKQKKHNKCSKNNWSRLTCTKIISSFVQTAYFEEISKLFSKTIQKVNNTRLTNTSYQKKHTPTVKKAVSSSGRCKGAKYNPCGTKSFKTWIAMNYKMKRHKKSRSKSLKITAIINRHHTGTKNQQNFIKFNEYNLKSLNICKTQRKGACKAKLSFITKNRYHKDYG